MSDAAPPPVWLDLGDISGTETTTTTQQRIPIQFEWALQRGVKRFVKRAVAVEHEFACHDRGAKRSAVEHIYEAERGIRRDWPDTELAYVGGHTFRCELKRADVVFDWTSGQGRLLQKLQRIGHGSAAATTVTEYGVAAELAGVPLVPQWRMIARHEEELVTGDIRNQRVKAEKKRAGTHKSRPYTPKPSASRVQRVNAVLRRWGR